MVIERKGHLVEDHRSGAMGFAITRRHADAVWRSTPRLHPEGIPVKGDRHRGSL